jgi:hypothetical protein
LSHGEEEGVGVGAGDVEDDVHEPSIPAVAEIRGRAKEDMVVETEEIFHGEESESR